jgi:orotate phosphoribosyltransferase-like protein
MTGRWSLAEVQDLAQKLPLWQRVSHLLKRGPLTLAQIADELDAKLDTVTKAVNRSRAFTKVPAADGTQRIALVERRSA